MKNTNDFNANWSEIHTDFEDNGFIHVDAYTTADDNEEGKVIAKISVTTGDVIYLDARARTDLFAQESIQLVLKDFCFNV